MLYVPLDKIMNKMLLPGVQGTTICVISQIS